MPCFLDCLSLLSWFMLPLLQVCLWDIVFCHYFFYDDWCIAIFFIDVLSSLMWCFVIHLLSCLGFALLHLWVALLILTCVLSVQGTLWAFIASCSTLFVGHDFAFRATYLVSSPWVLFAFLYAFACLVLSCRHFMWLCPLHTICDLFSHWSFHAYVRRFDFWLVSFVGVSSLDLGFVPV